MKSGWQFNYSAKIDLVLDVNFEKKKKNENALPQIIVLGKNYADCVKYKDIF